MSGKNVHVVGGWDGSTNSYHLTVFDDEDDVLWYAAEDLSEDQAKDVNAFKKALDKLGIKTPIGFWDRFEEKTDVMLKHSGGSWKRDW